MNEGTLALLIVLGTIGVAIFAATHRDLLYPETFPRRKQRTKRSTTTPARVSPPVQRSTRVHPRSPHLNAKKHARSTVQAFSGGSAVQPKPPAQPTDSTVTTTALPG